MTRTIRTNPRQFFVQLWGTLVKDGRYINVKYGSPIAPRRTEDLEFADDFISMLSSPFEDAFFRVHLQGPTPGEVTVATCAYGFFPYSDRSYTRITKAFREYSEPPSVVVHVGDGLEAYWLFKQPVWLPKPADRERFTEVHRLFLLELGPRMEEPLEVRATVPKTAKRITKLGDPALAAFLFHDYSRRYEVKL